MIIRQDGKTDCSYEIGKAEKSIMGINGAPIDQSTVKQYIHLALDYMLLLEDTHGKASREPLLKAFSIMEVFDALNMPLGIPKMRTVGEIYGIAGDVALRSETLQEDEKYEKARLMKAKADDISRAVNIMPV